MRFGVIGTRLQAMITKQLYEDYAFLEKSFWYKEVLLAMCLWKYLGQYFPQTKLSDGCQALTCLYVYIKLLTFEM